MHALQSHLRILFILQLALFCLAVPQIANAQAPIESADLAIVNAHVLQCTKDMQITDAVAVRDQRVIALGNKDVRATITEETEVIDAQGATLTPGFVDSHLHFVGLGQSLQMLDLRDAQSWDDIVDQVEAAASGLPKGSWIEGRGWHQSKWNETPAGAVDGYPSHKSMSERVPDHPVLLTHASGHASFANQAAMQAAGINDETSDPPGGEILKEASGKPLGVFRENAQSLVRRAKAEADRGKSAEALRGLLLQRIQLAGDACLKHGITGVHDAGSSFGLAQKMAELADADMLPVRVVMMIREGSRALDGRLERERKIDVGDGFFTVRSVKISIDGALGPHGAWLLQPYEDLPSKTGLNTVSLDELERIAQMCKQHSWQLCVHAIGDRANQEVLNAYEKVLGDDLHSDHRWRIEHAQHLAPEDIARFGAMGVIPAMQANHCTSDAIFVPRRLGERRSQQGAYVWRSLIDSGAIIPNGTDAPVELVDPRPSLFASVTRKLPNGDTFYPEQCMSREEALLSYTLWPAIAAFQEANQGSVEVGKYADFALWNRDLLKCDPEELLTVKVLRTFVGGEQRFQAAPEE